MAGVVAAGFCAAGVATGFFTAAVGCAAGALATTGTGLAVVVVVLAAVVVFLVVAAFAPGAGAAAVVEVLAEAPVVCVVVPLAGDIDVVPGVIAVAAFVPGSVPAGAHGAALAVFCAAAGAGAAAFFLKIDPRLENAVVAFETAVLAPAGT